MKALITYLLIFFVSLSFCSFSDISEEELRSYGYDDATIEQLKQDVILGETGIIDLSECNALLNVPDGFVFLDREQSKRLLVDYWNNPSDRVTDLLGTLVPCENSCFYQITVAYVISYSNCGYIKDDDANSIDYDELLKQLKDGEKEENEKLPIEQQMWLKGWAVQPKYLSSNHTLIWAKRFSANGDDVINYDMRILGKSGLVSVNAVVGQDDLSEVQTQESKMINSVQFREGYRYSDFDSSRDKISDWTIGGLVAGGVLAKTGILSKIGIFLLKFSKIIIVGVIAAAGAVFKLFRRNREE